MNNGFLSKVKVSTRDFHGRAQPYVEVTKIKTAEPILGYVYP